MFSGIVECVGTLERAEPEADGFRLAIQSGFDRSPLLGESVAVNGVCLTVGRAAGGMFEATAVPETLRRTTLGRLGPGQKVNLERALRVGDSLGGHWVLGHTDAVALIQWFRRDGGEVRVGIEIPEPFGRYVAEKGSLSVDGMSLTVAAWTDPIAVVALVPHTLSHTIASGYSPGVAVNLEVDIVARYLERLIEARGIMNEAAGSRAATGRHQ